MLACSKFKFQFLELFGIFILPIFSVSGWLNPQMENLWMRKTSCTYLSHWASFAKDKQKDSYDLKLLSWQHSEVEWAFLPTPKLGPDGKTDGTIHITRRYKRFITHILKLSEEGRASFPNKSKNGLREQEMETSQGFLWGLGSGDVVHVTWTSWWCQEGKGRSGAWKLSTAKHQEWSQTLYDSYQNTWELSYSTVLWESLGMALPTVGCTPP